MPRQIQLLDVVKLTENDERHRLRRGDVGTVVEVLAPDVFEVEFSDDDGRTYALATLHRNQVSEDSHVITTSAGVTQIGSTRLESIEGIGPAGAAKLRNAGVRSVVELSRRRADNLHAALVNTNATKKLVRRVPPEKQVAAWIEHAKTLPRAVSH